MTFPFTAIVGQDEMKLALELAAVDQSIGGVLVLGDRGTGKSTAVRALAAALPSSELRVKSDRLRPFETAEDHPLVQAALRSAGRERAIGSATMSDMALLQGTPAVKCGPGETARSHTPDEFVLASEVEAGEAFYAAFAPAALKALAAHTLGAS